MFLTIRHCNSLFAVFSYFIRISGVLHYMVSHILGSLTETIILSNFEYRYLVSAAILFIMYKKTRVRKCMYTV